jgi:hypothetical protein
MRTEGPKQQTPHSSIRTLLLSGGTDQASALQTQAAAHASGLHSTQGAAWSAGAEGLPLPLPAARHALLLLSESHCA